MANTHSIGNDYNGYLYKICIYQQIPSVLPRGPTFCVDSYCETCPLNESCVINCKHGEYLENGECHPCLSSCELGCLRGTDCRTCIEVTCQSCPEDYGVCDECIKNASKDSSGACVCNDYYFYSFEHGACELCPSACPNCIDDSTCADCDLGHFIFPETDLCLDFCPSGLRYDAFSKTCVVQQLDICFEFSEKTLPSAVAGVTLTSQGDAPTPAYSRGLYFDGSTTLIAENLVLNPIFTLEYWIRAESVDGTLMKIIDDAKSVFVYGLLKNSLRYVSGKDSISAGVINTNDWAQVVAYTNNVTVDLHINTVSVLVSTVTLTEQFLDLYSDEHRIGDGYTGFIYKICVYQYIPDILPINPEDCGKGYCDICAEDTCLIDCGLNQYLDKHQKHCVDCDGCTEGCMRSTNCTNCLSPTCAECPEEYGTCTVCIEDASKNDLGECECAAIFLEELGRCGTCLDNCCGCSNEQECHNCCDGFYLNEDLACSPCSEECNLCEDGSNKRCSECALGFYLIPHTTQCEDFCPSGLVKTQGNCELDGDTHMCFTFSDIPMPPTVHAVTLAPGEPDIKSPIPAYDRGYYFDGDVYISVDGLVYNTVFTETFWHRPTGPGQLFSVMTPEGIEITRLDVLDHAIKFEYYGTPIMGGPIQMDIWQIIHIALNKKFMAMAQNGAILRSADIPEMIIDRPENIKVMATNYNGFIYQMCIYQWRKINNWGIDQSGLCGNDKCQNCPQDVCLTNCEIAETYDDEQQMCVDCLSECTDGCIRTTDCRTCAQEFCTECQTHDTCQSCIEGAEAANGICECNSPKLYLPKVDICGVCLDNCSYCEEPTVCITCEDNYFLSSNDTCVQCNPACATCTDETNTSCGSCSTGYTHLSDTTICVPIEDCPTGIAYDENLQKCVSTEPVEYCFEFGDKLIEQTDNEVSISADSDSVDGPFAVYKRGIYFSAGSKLIIDGLVLNTSFTLEFWISPEGDGSLLDISTYAAFDLESLVPRLVRGDVYDSGLTLTNEWHRVLYVANAADQTLRICRNDDECYLSEFVIPFVDSLDYEHTIGLLYTGFLYKFCVYQYVNYPMPIDPSVCDQGYCINCPPGTCVIDCPLSHTLVDGSCVECNNCPQGCIYPEDCDMCVDRYCQSCSSYEGCEECAPNAILNPETGLCECDASHRPSDDFQCVDCHPACALCVDGTDSSCDACNEGYFKQADTTICKSYCPSLLDAVDQKCQTGPEKAFCLTFTADSIFEQLTPSPDSVPISIYQRGLYFDGMDYVETSDYILNTSFTIEVYAWYERAVSHGSLFEALMDISIWDFYVNAQNVKFHAFGGNVPYIPNGAMPTSRWTSAAIAVQPTKVNIFVNGALVDSVTNDNILFLDTPDSIHRIGQGFIGMIYHVCYSQFTKDTFTAPDPLPPSCPHNQTIDCESCPEGCDTGCIRTTDCRNCLDPLCESCSDYDTCESCMDNADLQANGCVCNEPNYYQPDLDKCQPCPEPCLKCTNSDSCEECQDGWYLDGNTCRKCSDDCETCRDSGASDNCETCPDGKFMLPGTGICQTSCPSGYEKINGQCEASDNMDFCFEFSEKTIAQTSNGASTILPDSSDLDPKWILSRGIYFDGDDYLQIVSLSLNTVSTMEFWIRPENSGILLKISTIDVVYSLQELAPTFGIGQEEHTSQSVQSTWTHVAYVVDVKSLKLNINGMQVYEGDLQQVIIDQQHYQHVVGIDYEGFIYKICASNYSITSFEIEEAQCVPDLDCLTCPIGVCLSECAFDQYIEDDRTCETCLPKCAEGCVRSNNCGKCEDELCAVCSEFSTCDTCLDHASISDSQCTCDDPYRYSRDEGICRLCHTNCAECQDLTLECTQCQDGYYNDANSNPYSAEDDCKPCNEACATCTDDTTTTCDSCQAGFYKLPHTTSCVNYCPTLLLNENGECSEEPLQQICFEFSDKDLPLGLEAIPPAPTPVYQRGIYFDGSNVLLLDELILSTHFTLEFYFKSTQGGELFSVRNSSPEWALHYTSGRVELVVHTEVEHSIAISQNEWTQVAVSKFLGSAILTINGVSSHVADTLEFIDNPDTVHKLGDGYVGLMYQLCIYQYKKEDFTLLDPLPNDCAHDEVAGTCDSCLPDCEACTRATDCRNCEDALCEDCPNFDKCKRCIDDAELIDGVCVCAQPKYYLQDIDSCSLCIEDCIQCTSSTACEVCEDGSFLNDGESCSKCHPNCETCTSSSETDCATCPDGSALLPHINACAKSCPSGYEPSNSECVQVGETSTCFSFSDKDMNQSLNDIEIRGGGTVEITPEPALNRGLYFDGDDILNISNFMFDTNFTVEFWIKPVAGGSLMQVNGDYLMMKLSNGFKLAVDLEFETSEDLVSVQQEWTNVAYQFDNKQLRFLINGTVSSTDTLSQIIFDSPDYSHIIGLEYVGFLYKFCLHNSSDITPEITNPNCVPDVECVNCPDDTCVSECSHRQFIHEDASCGECHEDCASGCVRYPDCRTCTSEFCQECPSYDTCEQCVSGAVLVDGECVCPPEKPYDFTTDKCGDCHLGCSDCSNDGELWCFECDPGYYLVQDEFRPLHMCQPCNTSCKTCTDGTTDSCSACTLGYFLLPGSTSCVDYCPSALEKSGDHTCLESPLKEICFVFDDKSIEQKVNGVTTNLDTDPNPFIVYERGLYFDGTTRLSLDNLVLNTQFTLEFVVRPSVPGGDMMHIPELVLSAEIYNEKWGFQLDNQQVHAGTYDVAQWYNFALAVAREANERSTVHLYINNLRVGSPLTLDSLIIDSPENSHTFGTGFNGFLYRMCVYQYINLNFILDDLSNCGLDEIPQEDGTCLDCLDSCEEGCLRETDCRSCEDALCDSCTESFSGPCDPNSCIAGAVFDDGECLCQDPNYYQSDIDVCGVCQAEGCAQCELSSECQVCQDSYYLGDDYQCYPCNPACKLCESESNDNCEECSDGNYKQPGTNTCKSSCPNGFVPEDGVCEEPRDPKSLDFCFVFENSTYLTVGNATVGLSARASTHPKSMDSRGLYFDGDDTLMMTGMSINRTFSLEFWIRPYVEESSNADLFDIASAGTTRFTLIRSSEFSFAGFEHETFSAQSNVALERAWTHVAYVITSGSTLSIYINGNGENFSFTDIIVGHSEDDAHRIGQDYNGFLYSLCLRQRVFAEFDIDTTVPNCPTPLNCAFCPRRTCLSNCEFDTFLENGQCADCLDTCTKGCVRDSDCRPCADELCDYCPDSEICEQCLPGAQNPDQCECQEGLQYYAAVGECVPCSENCDLCSYGTLVCDECKTGYYADGSVTCAECDSSCSECYDGDSQSCTRCSEGFYLIPNTTQCEPQCPSGLSHVDRACKEIPLTSFCFNWTDKQVDITDEVSGVQVKYSMLYQTSPYAAYQRGIYLEGTKLVLPDLILNTIFTLEFVVRPDSDGQLLSITNPAQESFLLFELTSDKIRFNYMPDIIIEDGSWDLKTWHNVAITVKLTQVTLYLDNVQVGNAVSRDEISVDSLANNHAIGQDYNGFMYKFCVYQYANLSFDITSPPPSCDLDQLVPDCQDCSEDCLNGCIRSDDCRMCEDPLCEVCDTYDEDCSDAGCIENANVNEAGVCQCEAPFNYLQDMASCGTCVNGCEFCSSSTTCDTCSNGYFLNEDSTCTQCNENCAECTNETNECAVCNDESVHMPGTERCAPGCPTGFSNVGQECTLYLASHCFVFSDKAVQLTSGLVWTVSTGSDPTPMYNRGLYFDGDDSLGLQDLVFNTEFMLDFWLRPYVDPENNGTLLHAQGSIDVLFGLSNNSPRMEFLINHVSTESLSKVWSHLRYEIRKSVMSIYINDFLLTHDNSVIIGDTIIDEVDNTHTIGNGYIGFIYKICITQEIADISDIDPSPQCGPNSCTHCPIDKCLSSCDHTQYLDSENESCGDCEAGCETGCIRSTDCRNCFDEKCDICSEWDTCDTCIPTADKDEAGVCQCQADTVYSCDSKECGPCNESCLECEPCELDCTLCEDGSYVDESGACSTCNDACETCADETTTNCPKCSVGWYKFPNTNICRDYCPTKLPKSRRDCVEEDASICISFDDMTITKSDADSGVTVVLDGQALPFAVDQRGLYFTSECEMSLSDLVINTRFTLEFVIRPIAQGSLLTILEPNESHLLTFALTANALSLQAHEQSSIVAGSWLETKWYNVAVGVDLTSVHFFVDGVAYETVEVLQSLVVDALKNSHIVGREYQGFLYTICIHQFLATDFVTPTLSECEVYQTADCQDCLESCTTGCIRPTDCRKCDDALCEDCPGSDACIYGGCIEGASLVDGVCQCNLTLSYLIDIDQCYVCPEGCETCTATTNCPSCVDKYFKDGDICSPCSQNCANCFGPGADECTECVEGTYFYPDVPQCEPGCPSGYEPQDVNCVAIQPSPRMQDFCFVFDDKDMHQISNGVELNIDVYPHLKPKPILNRGIYFDGTDSLVITNLAINTVATLDYWIRPESAGWFMSITTENETAVFLIIEVTPPGQPDVIPIRAPVFTNVSVQIGFADILTAWTHLQYRLNNKSIKFFVNGDELATVGQERNTVFIDKIEYPHSLGTGYTGMIYSICIRNYAATSNDIDPNPQCNENECTICPVGVCLSECEFDQIYKNGEPCDDCQEECEEGCIRPTDCRNCFDELCARCSQYEGVCERCVENASFDREKGHCVCNRGNQFYREEGKCLGCFENCTACKDITLECIECSEGYYLETDPETSQKSCVQCDEKCKTCQDGTNHLCPTCADGYSQWPVVDVCEAFCPSGLVSLDNVCIEDDISLCFEFSGKVLELESHGVTLALSESNTVDPKPIHARGLYFDGSMALILEDLVLNPRFTLEYWIRTENVDGELMTVRNDTESVFIFGLKSAVLWYQSGENTIFSGEVTTYDWVLVAAYTDTTNLDLHINNVSQMQSTVTLSKPFVDVNNDVHRIGEDYTGFIYKICIHQYVPGSLPISPEYCGKGFCSVCPLDMCLIDCDFDQYVDEMTGRCGECDGCSDGCIRSNDCRNCLEPE